MANDAIRESLNNEEQRLGALRDDLRSGDDLDGGEHLEGNSGGELSTADQHPADLASEQTQREVSLSMLEQIEAEIADVERALAKLDEGKYGTCEACGKPIAADRLEVLPAARFCIDDQGKAESEIQLRSTLNNPNVGTEATTI